VKEADEDLLDLEYAFDFEEVEVDFEEREGLECEDILEDW